MLITPHVTPRLDDRDQRMTDILLENIRRYREDLPLLNQLTSMEQFTPRGPHTQSASTIGKHAFRFSSVLRRIVHRFRTR